MIFSIWSVFIWSFFWFGFTFGLVLHLVLNLIKNLFAFDTFFRNLSNFVGGSGLVLLKD